MAVVIFDEDYFLSIYPQFKDKLTTEQLQNAFDIACIICNNTDSSLIPYDPDTNIYTRRSLLYLLLCHLSTLALRPFDQAGPTASATQGSVSVSFQMPSAMDSSYFSQTPCGSTYWQLIRQYSIGGRLITASNYHPWG